MGDGCKWRYKSNKIGISCRASDISTESRMSMSNSKKLQRSAQTTLEFTFSLIIILLLLYSCVMIFRWAGVSLMERRVAHDSVLTESIDESWVVYNSGPLKQLKKDFYKPDDMNFVFNGW